MRYRRLSFDLNDLSTWQSPVTVSISLLLGFAFFSFWKILFIDEVRTKIQQIQPIVTKQKQLYARNQSLISSIPAIEAEIEQFKTTKNLAKTFLPTEISMPSLIDSIYVAAQRNHIVFDELAPKEDINETFYFIKPITLTAVADYSSILGFAEDIANSKRIITIHNMTLTAPVEDTKDKKQQLKMTAELRTYIFKENLQEQQ